MSEPLEIEAKFEFDSADRDRLLAVTTLGRFAVESRSSFLQEDTYFDTSDAQLAATGATLRIRRTASDTKMTFKGRGEASGSTSEDHITSRLEDEVPLDASQVERLSTDGPMPDLEGVTPLARARELVGSAQLVPVAHLRNSRTILMLASGGKVLELAVDDCVGTRLRDGRTVTFDEVELESKSADRAAVRDASRALQQLVPSLRPSRKTKLERTLG